ncbi:MAG: hypothetical protein ACK40G_03110 [Cytophagaceae bacterium]
MKKQHVIFKALVILPLCIALFSSCKKDLPEAGFIGEEYRSAPEGFNVTSDFVASPEIVNFTSTNPTQNKVTFNVTMSHAVTYFIELRGVTSGATYNFTGISDKLENNPIWDGSHDGISFFRGGEKVVARIKFLGSSISLTDTVIIQRAKVYGFLISDFESLNSGLTGLNWFGFGGEATTNGIEGIIPAIQGTRYFRIKGTDNIQPFYYVDGYGFQSGKFLAGYTNPDSVYFNILVYGNGVEATKLSVNFGEDDNNNGLNDDTGAPNYTVLEDQLTYEVKVDWKGWKWLSVKYSQIPFSRDMVGQGNLSAQGNYKREPHKIVKMGFILLTDPSKSPGDLIFDYPTFTIGKPLQLKDQQ